MVVHRDENWVPEFAANTRRPVGPSSSAPSGRTRCGGSVTPASPNSSDDEASSAGNITNRCSPKAVFAIASKLSEFKKQIVRDIGFGGILDIPCISKINLKLSARLLSKLDSEESCLVFGPSRRIYVHEGDVGIVLGIPQGDIDISTTSVTDEQLDLLRSSIGLVGSDPRSIKGIDYVLEKHLDDQSLSQEIDGFKVAFVVFVIGHLLAPCVKHDQVHLDFWGALKNPGSLDRFNWCRYVYGHVLEAAQKVRSEIITKGRATSLTGCHYFLQILFLDNIDLNKLNKPHKVVPRVRVFDQESVKVMAVMCASRGEQDFEQFIGIRSAESSVYMRHTYQSPHVTPAARPAAHGRSMLAGPTRMQQKDMQSDNSLNPDSYTFQSPIDFSLYIRKRHPGLERTYAIDYIKNFNSLMMKEISNLRSSIMRRNAHLVDWLADHFGSTQMQLVHKKPGSPASTPSTVLATSASHSRSQAIQLPPKSTSMNIKRQVSEPEVTPAKKIKSIQGACIFSSLCNCDVDVSCTPLISFVLRHLLSLFAFCQVFINGCVDVFWFAEIGGAPPSFDLGIDDSPAGHSAATPKNRIFTIEGGSSPMQAASSKPASTQPSCAIADISAFDASRHEAQCIILDIVHVTEESIDPTGKVLYGQWITGLFDKIVAPAAPVHSAPWTSDLHHPLHDPTIIADVIGCCTELSYSTLRREWLVHPMPRFLVLTGTELISSFIEGKNADSDIIDAAFRRFRQIDATTLSSDVPVRWRHFMESVLAMNCLAGYSPDMILPVLNQFTKVDYYVPSCQMIIMPVLVEHVWCAYMFDVHRAEAHVLDPAYAADRFHVHQEIYKMLLGALHKCMDCYFQGCWLKPTESWKMQYPMLCAGHIIRDESAFVMLHCARCFDGVQLQEPINKDNIANIRHSILMDILMMDDNAAHLPDSVRRCLR